MLRTSLEGEGMDVKAEVWKVVDEPLPWYAYLLIPAGAMVGNFLQLGVSPATIRGGLLVGVVLLGVMLGVRRLVVGHWR